MNATRILIADDHDAFRRSLRSLIESREEWRVCGEAANGLEVVNQAKSLRPDLILMDVSMPEMNGLDATRAIHKEQPDSRILIISQNDADLMRRSAADVGALGFIQKSRVSQDLFEFLRKLSNGNGNGASSESPTEPSAHAVAASSLDFLRGDSEMATRMRSLDWSSTPLGPVESWSPALRMMAEFLLANRFPQLLWWGPEFCCLYNDAYIPILGEKHPWALGHPVAEVWHEIWEILKPLIETPFKGGPATWMEDIELFLKRRGFVEETHFTIAYSPVPDETVASGIGGVLATVHEITEKVVGQRRVVILRELGTESADSKTAEEACARAAHVLSRHTKDAPFALFYLLDNDVARLAAWTGIEGNNAALLERIGHLDGKREDQPLPVRKLIETESICVIDALPGYLRGMPEHSGQSQVNTAAMVPVRSNLSHQLAGFIVVGISPHLQFDDSYRNFLELLSTQVATSIANARAYEAERKRSEALAEIDRAKTAFFSNVSHEFRTPLTLMLAPLEDMLAAGSDLPDSQRERLDVAHRNSLRLLKLVNALLDFSRIEAGRIQASYEPTDLSVLTAELASVFRSVVERAGLRLVVNCAGLPQKVYVDREMWEKIVFNLLSNAFKFTFDGEIRVSLQPVGPAVELSVTDTGTGIPSHEIPRLFERFHRVKDARGRSFEGSGIGLALVQELARLHGGMVQVESEVDRGSKFAVTIPFGKDHLPQDRVVGERELSEGIRGEAFVEEALRWLPDQGTDARESAAAALLSSAEPVNRPGQGTSSSARILLADDNSDMREYVRRLLAADYDVVTVADGESALQEAQKHPPDLILSDVMMPRMDGIALLGAIRADAKLNDIPLILLSARAGEESRVEGLSAGADDYLIKPFSARELMARVHSHLSMAKLRAQSTHLQRELMLESELERKRLSELFSHIPAAICLLSGPEHRYTFVNQEYLKLTGRERPGNFIGKTVREALPEFEGQPFLALLDQVYATGTPHIGKESKVILNNSAGVPQDVYHNFIYQPQRGISGAVERILVHVVDVTEQVLARKEFETRARASALLAAIVASSDDAIISKNLDGIITSWNNSAERIFGYTAEEAIGRHITLIIPPDRYPEENEIISRLRRGEPVDHFETVRMRKDGTYLDVSVTISPLRNTAGEVIGASKVARDVTAHKRIERALRESEGRLRALVNASANIIYRVNADWSEMWQLDGRGFISDTVRPTKNWIKEYVYSEDQALVEATIQQAVRTKNVFELEHRVLRVDGSIGWTLSRAVPLLGPDGEITEWFGAASDVSRRKQAEELLRKTNERFDFVAEAAQVGFWFCDLPFNKLEWADRVKEHFWLPPEAEVTIDTFYERIHPDDRQRVRLAIEACIDSNSQYDIEYRTVAPDGREKWVRAIGNAFYDESGHPTRFDGLTMDITARKQAEVREREIAAEAVAAQERYRELAQRLELEVVSRTREIEDRNADIIRQSELLRDLSRRLLQAQDEERRRIARELHDSAGQTLTVLGMTIALIGKSAPRKAEIHQQLHDAEQLVQQLHQEIRTMSYLLHPPLLDEAGLRAALTWYVEGLRSRSGLEMTLEIDDGFERLPRDMELVVFRLVQESLTNIHRHSGSKTAAIRISRDATTVTLEVRDQGKGMSSHKLSEIQSKGSGVGIRGMRERVRQFQGDLQIQSSDAGTRVVVTIPMPKSISHEEAASMQLAV